MFNVYIILGLVAVIVIAAARFMRWKNMPDIMKEKVRVVQERAKRFANWLAFRETRRRERSGIPTGQQQPDAVVTAKEPRAWFKPFFRRRRRK